MAKRYRNAGREDFKKILQYQYSEQKVEDITNSYSYKELMSAIFEERGVYVEKAKEKSISKYSPIVRFTFPLFLLVIVVMWIVLAIRWLLTGKHISMPKQDSFLDKVLYKWNVLGNFKVM